MSKDTVVEFRQPAGFADALVTRLHKKVRDLLCFAIKAKVTVCLNGTDSPVHATGARAQQLSAPRA